MPYIEKEQRDLLGNGCAPLNAGELAYAVTRQCRSFLYASGKMRFLNLAIVLGVLFCCALEIYRRVGVPYENAKWDANGDVFDLTKLGAKDGNFSNTKV